MALTVEIYGIRNGEDELLGTIIWNGTDFLTDPEDSPILEELLETPLRMRGGEELLAADDPEEFMTILNRHYRGTALRASEAKDLT